MGSETLKRKSLVSGEAGKSVHKQNHGTLKGRHENLGSNGAGASSSYDDTTSGEEDNAAMHVRDADGNLDMDALPDSVVSKKERHRELTFQDMYENQDLFDDDEEDDSDWEPVQKHVRDADGNLDVDALPDSVVSKKERHRELTFQDMYENQDLFDDEEDDSDWEPVQKHVEILKWFCTNCTMVNLDDVVYCEICGEHKESGILRRGFFASAFSQDAGVSESKSEGKERDKDDGRSKQSSSHSSTIVGFDERMLLHSEVEMKSHPHPERPNRLRAIAASLATAGIFPGRCYPIPAREITLEELQRVHALEHIQAVELTGRIFSSVYSNVRPPGHHAGVSQAMGFCLHNNAAVAALAAQLAGAKKVLIVDWDVHHGNGTQEIFDQNKSVLYISLHRHEDGKFYPGTGAASEVGTNGAEGLCVNIPWSRGGVGDNDYIFAFQHVVLPIAAEFDPDFTIISAGFDAARGDPLGCCDVTPAGYAQMTQLLYTLSGGKLLVILEGGYNLRSISSSATAVIEVLLGESPSCVLGNAAPSKSGLLTVLKVLKIQMNFWPSLRPGFAKLQSLWEAHFLANRSEKPLLNAVFFPCALLRQ
ncbi:Histone deacetylase 15 [Turnera subulata]|uniref:histone deacetylase n=1 Tax=Turnera subulata TaxID=218843 RepID=A0A9Q0EYN3_9ROSI|nr:Histone deacetylase 15 [Turnera subulata]